MDILYSVLEQSKKILIYTRFQFNLISNTQKIYIDQWKKNTFIKNNIRHLCHKDIIFKKSIKIKFFMYYHQIIENNLV